MQECCRFSLHFWWNMAIFLFRNMYYGCAPLTPRSWSSVRKEQSLLYQATLAWCYTHVKHMYARLLPWTFATMSVAQAWGQSGQALHFPEPNHAGTGRIHYHHHPVRTLIHLTTLFSGPRHSGMVWWCHLHSTGPHIRIKLSWSQ